MEASYALVSTLEPSAATTRTVSATEARVHLGGMIRAVTDFGQDVIVEKAGRPMAERMMRIHQKIAEKWVGPGLTAEEVDDMINDGQR